MTRFLLPRKKSRLRCNVYCMQTAKTPTVNRLFKSQIYALALVEVYIIPVSKWHLKYNPARCFLYPASQYLRLFCVSSHNAKFQTALVSFTSLLHLKYEPPQKKQRKRKRGLGLHQWSVIGHHRTALQSSHLVQEWRAKLMTQLSICEVVNMRKTSGHSWCCHDWSDDETCDDFQARRHQYKCLLCRVIANSVIHSAWELHTNKSTCQGKQNTYIDTAVQW